MSDLIYSSTSPRYILVYHILKFWNIYLFRYQEILRRKFGPNSVSRAQFRSIFNILIFFCMQNDFSNCYIVLMYKKQSCHLINKSICFYPCTHLKTLATSGYLKWLMATSGYLKWLMATSGYLE